MAGTIFNATSGIDTFNGGGGNQDDTLNFTASNQANAGDSFTGGGGTDTVNIASGLTIDLTPATFATWENVLFLGAGGVTVNQSQLAGLGNSFTGVNSSLQL